MAVVARVAVVAKMKVDVCFHSAASSDPFAADRTLVSDAHHLRKAGHQPIDTDGTQLLDIGRQPWQLEHNVRRASTDAGGSSGGGGGGGQQLMFYCTSHISMHYK